MVSSDVKIDVAAIKHVLLQHQRRVFVAANEEDFQRIGVRRSNLFNDAFRAFSKPTFNVKKVLKVRFMADPGAVDDGGPRREFFSLLNKQMFSMSGLFHGWPENVCPIHDFTAVANNKFYIVGKMLASCLVQGGEPPVCFSEGVADFLVNDQITSPPCINDIPDYEVRQHILKVSFLDVRGLLTQFCGKFE